MLKNTIPGPDRLALRLLCSLMLVLGMVVTMPQTGSGQMFHARLHTGTLYYQGDLAPRPLKLSFGPGNLAWGISGGYNITPWMSLNSRFMIGRISGNDSYAEDPGRKSRNLSFYSPLYEYGMYSDVCINKLWKGLDKYKLRMYINLGFNVFKFNPQAWYIDRYVELQPLGTEGQTIPGTGKSKYSLTDFSRVIGFSTEFDIGKRWALGLELTPRKTWTDYLDDVSGTYVNYDEMVAAGNTLGAALSNRTGEYLGTGPVKVATGTGRGRPDKNDWYTFIGFYVKFRIGKAFVPTYHPPDDSDIPPDFLIKK